MMNRNRLLLIILLLGIVLIGAFAWRAYHHYQYLQKAEQSVFTVESLRGWMTLGYIAERYHVPLESLYAALGIKADNNKNLSLRGVINKYQLDAIEARHAIEAVILAQSTTGKSANGVSQ